MREAVKALADAVLYEGYILWPYRRSALKNQRRFTFGGVHPPSHHRRHPDDRAAIRGEVLLECAPGARVEVAVRFLQIVDRAVARRGERELEPVEELTVEGERYLAWEEAVEREVGTVLELGASSDGRHAPIEIAAGREQEELRERNGAPAGALIRSWHQLRGELSVGAERLKEQLWRVRVVVSNSTSFAGGSRQRALEQSFCSTHLIVEAHDGSFVSLSDPPEALAEAARSCRNEGVWPVLVGDPGQRTTMLCSPIILEDDPRIAPESPGDLFDGGEIDQLLILNILTLTDEEKAEMRASDPRAAEILDRTERLEPDQLMRLHGAIREFGLARSR